jgi:hypothetical protein
MKVIRQAHVEEEEKKKRNVRNSPPLRREGAIIMLTPAKQALELAMSRLSPPPE